MIWTEVGVYEERNNTKAASSHQKEEVTSSQGVRRSVKKFNLSAQLVRCVFRFLTLTESSSTVGMQHFS